MQLHVIKCFSKKNSEWANCDPCPEKPCNWEMWPGGKKYWKNLYSFLLQKKLETSISSASTISNSTVVEPAWLHTNPISPNKNKIYSVLPDFWFVDSGWIYCSKRIIKG